MERIICTVRGIVLFLAIIIWLGSCQKNNADPNENWLAGKEWIDERDGNAYATVQIGYQVWMAENFNFQADSGSWVYENQVSNASLYGRLYDWETAIRICPQGWHVPLEEEWQEMIDYLGGYDIAGGKLKESGFVHWEEPNEGATNSAGFSALPGGYMWSPDQFSDVGMYAHFWSSSKYDFQYAYRIELSSLGAHIIKTTANLHGSACAVRYIRD